MRSQGNLKADMLQPYNIQSSYQSKGSNIGQKSSKSSQNRSSQIYTSIMSPQSQSGYGSINYSNQAKIGASTEQYTSQGNPSTQSSSGKNLSLTSTLPQQYNKLNSEGQTPANIQSQLGGGNSYSLNKPNYGYGNYNTIDNVSSNITDNNYLYNGHRQQNKKLNTAGNQSASSIIGYGGIINSQGNGLSQSLQQQQIINKPGNYVMTENNQLLLPKLQNQTDGPILVSRQMNVSNSEKINLRSQPTEIDNIQNSSQKKQDVSSKNNLRNIVKYQNSTPQAQANPYSSTFQQQISASSSIENQPQQQLVNLNNQGRMSNGAIATGSNNNQSNGTDNRGNQNSQNSTQNYYNITSARPPSNNNPKKDLSQTSQYPQYSSLGSPTNTSQQQKLQQSQQSIISPNSKSSRLQTSNDNSQKTPLKVIQPTQNTGYNSIYQTNQPQLNAKVSQQNASTNPDLLDARMLPKIDKSKISTKQIGNVIAYGANTHQGLVRSYNEDRVSIILNMVKPPEKSNVADWPNISFFAIYDGHGGANCADFLRDQLHFYIIKDDEFPKNPQKAIHNGFVKAEEQFLKQADSQNPLDKSGSCVIVVMLISNQIFCHINFKILKKIKPNSSTNQFYKCTDEMIYVANLGDSRAILCSNNGQKVQGLTVDHKPNHPDEEKRIIMNGGKIYQSQFPTLQPKSYPQFVKGPHRVLPGRLAVSRAMGDAEAKLKKYGGNPKVILCEPEITSFALSSEQDFIMLGCDGIFDKLTNNQSIDFIWESMREAFKKKEMRQSIHDYIGDGIENLIKQTLIHKSFDNLTVVLVCFKSLEKLLLA